MTPDYGAHPQTGFAVTGKPAAQTLAVAVTGRFTSAFAGKGSPLLAAPAAPAAADKGGAAPGGGAVATPKPSDSPGFAGVIDRSPDGAKLVVVSSSTFGSDLTLDLATQGMGTAYAAPIDFLQNVADWATQDPALLALRGRTEYANTLRPMTESVQALWEYLDYAFAVIGLVLVWGWRLWTRGRDRARYARIVEEVTA